MRDCLGYQGIVGVVRDCLGIPRDCWGCERLFGHTKGLLGL